MTELVFILDQSGSMSDLEADTIGGFNSMIRKQRGQGDAIVSTVLFNTQASVIHDRVPLDSVAKLTEEDYCPRGCTALLDAVGGAIRHISIVHKYARDEDRPDKTLVVIITDGLENASRLYSYDEVQRMISRQKEENGWEFLFLGANMDAVHEARRIGIDAGRAATYMASPVGTAENFVAMDCAITALRETGEVPDNWSDGIRETLRKHK